MSNEDKRDALDYKTLERVKQLFDIQSDNSTACHGYRRLCEIMEKIKEQRESDNAARSKASCGAKNTGPWCIRGCDEKPDCLLYNETIKKQQ